MDFSEHVSEEAIEQYAKGTLPAAEVEPFEGHLLDCSFCQNRLRRTDEFMAPLCAALSTIAQGATRQERPRMDDATIGSSINEYFHVQNQLVELRSRTIPLADDLTRLAQALRGSLDPQTLDHIRELPTDKDIRGLVGRVRDLSRKAHELRQTLERAGVFSKE